MTSTEVPLSLNKLFSAFDMSMQSVNTQREREMGGPQTAIEHHMSGYKQFEKMNGLRRVQMCRKALDALDRRGWDRSFHQRLFHEEYLKSCARSVFVCFVCLEMFVLRCQLLPLTTFNTKKRGCWS